MSKNKEEKKKVSVAPKKEIKNVPVFDYKELSIALGVSQYKVLSMLNLEGKKPSDKMGVKEAREKMKLIL